MKTHHPTSIALALAAAFTLSLWPGFASGQPAAAASAASAAPPVKAIPRAQTIEQAKDGATVPGDLRPANPVVPQISVPLGRTPPAPVLSQAEAERQRRALANGGIDDAVARCRAMTTEPERAACRQQQRQNGQQTQPSKR